MRWLKPRGRLLGTYALLYGIVAYVLVVTWEGDDWGHLDVVAVLLVTTVALDAIDTLTDYEPGPGQTYGGTMSLALAIVLLGPAPAALIGLVTNLIYSRTRRAPVHYALGNAFAYSAAPLAIGLVCGPWIDALNGVGFALAAALLTIVFDLCTTPIIFVQAWAHGDLVLRREAMKYVRVVPWLCAASIVVAGAADGYRAGGPVVLGMFMVALLACEFLLVRLDAVEVHLRAERDRSATYLRTVGTMVVSLDAGGRVAFVNERAGALLGDVVGEKWDAVDTGGRILAWNSTPLPEGATLLSGEDVTARREAEDRMAQLAFVDTLTGLANRTVLDRELPVALAAADGAGTAAALLLIDIDAFKAVNDAHGHATGDLVLSEAAFRLRAVAAPDEMLIRRGGDEFLLLAPSLGARADDEAGARRAAGAIAERMVRAFEAPFPVAGRIGVSVAMALHPFDGGDLEQVAGAALHGIKQRALERIS